jgi:hypothetical protein
MGLPENIFELGRAGGHLSPSQRNKLCLVKQGCEEKAARIRKQLEEPSQNQESLLADLRELELEIVACKGLLSYLRLIPLEVMQIIFRFYFNASTRLSDPAAKGSTGGSPQCRIALSQVCRWWQEVAWSSPWLWSPVRIPAGQHARFSEPPMVAGAAIPYLLREIQLASPGPWSLKIDACGGPPDRDRAFRPYKEPIATLLREEQLSTLRKLSVHFDGENTTFQGFNLPALDSLVVRWGEPAPRMVESSFLPSMPTLTKAVLSGMVAQFFELPCSRLTHLYIGGDGLHLATWVRVMEVCTALCRGCFCIDLEAEPPEAQERTTERNTTVAQPHLQELTILNPNDFDLPHTGFYWPALKTFKYSVGWGSPEQWAPGLNHVQNIFSSLTCFSLSGAEQIDFATHLAPILLACHSLEELDLLVTPYESLSTVEYFTHQQGHNNLTHLRTLGLQIALWDNWPEFHLDDVTLIDTSDEDKRLCSSVCDMITSRIASQGPGSNTPLESLALRLDYYTRYRSIARRPSQALKQELEGCLEGRADGFQFAIVPARKDVENWPYQANKHTLWGHWDEDFINCLDAQLELSTYS